MYDGACYSYDACLQGCINCMMAHDIYKYEAGLRGYIIYDGACYTYEAGLQWYIIYKGIQ
jgi:hypothetical protein